MILGIGLDITPVARMERALERHGERFERRIFTPQERRFCHDRGKTAQHFAARFAAKEAWLKAMGVPKGLEWHELEVVNDPGGRPVLQIKGRAAEVSNERGVCSVHLTLTHTESDAAAVVVVEGR